ncbi:MAG: methyltransferase family protein [Bacteroidota bacterium]
MDFRQRIFQYRSYIPLPFLLLMIFFAQPNLQSIAAGLVVVLTGEFIRLWGVSIAGSETRTTGPVGGTFLITKGPFAYVRNPLYVGNIVIYCGFGIMAKALWLLLMAFIFFTIQYTLIVSLEEEHLLKAFGDDYRRYSGAVPRFFPTGKKFTGGTNIQPGLEWARGIVSEKSTLLAITLVTLLMVAYTFYRG